MKIWKALIVLGVLAIFSAVFLFTGFHVASSNTQSDNGITTASSGEGLPVAMEHREPITLVVKGEGGLADALRDTLTAELSHAGLGDIKVSPTVDPALTTPVLVVDVGNPKIIWTPFYATSRLTVRAGYSSFGDASFLESGTTFTSNVNGPAMTMTAEYNVNDTSMGLISRPAYDYILANWLTRQLVTVLTKAYTPAQGTGN